MRCKKKSQFVPHEFRSEACRNFHNAQVAFEVCLHCFPFKLPARDFLLKFCDKFRISVFVPFVITFRIGLDVHEEIFEGTLELPFQSAFRGRIGSAPPSVQ